MSGYADKAFEYFHKGWAPLPLKHKSKAVGLPQGYTGYGYATPSGADITEWIEQNPNGNICVHLPKGIVGIDVDNYNGKNGAATLNEAIRRWGPLPPAPIATSREDRVSGIRFFRVPEDSHLQTIITFPALGISNIEIVQYYHRFAVVHPSLHPDTNRAYEWYDAAWNKIEIPAVADLPELPKTWLDGLARDEQAEITARADAREQLSALPSGPMSKKVRNQLAEAKKALHGASESRHDATTRSTARLLRLGEQGETGVSEALAELGEEFVIRTSDRNTPDEAREEYRRMVVGSRVHDLIASTPTPGKVEDLIGETQAPRVDHVQPLPTMSQTEAIEIVTKLLGAQQVRLTPEERHTTDQAVSTPVINAELPLGDEVPEDEFEAFLSGRSVRQQVSPPTAVVQEADTSLSFFDRLLDIDGLRRVLPAAPMIEGILYRNTLAQVSGKPGSYKSFFALALACAVASPLTMWEGHPVVHHGPVIYVAAEGVSGMRVRVESWCKDTGVKPEDLLIRFFPEPFEIDDMDHVEQVKEMVRRTECALLVIDTRARVNGDLDENSASDQGKAIAAVEQIRAETQATVLVVHHTGKAGIAGGGRGSNAWDGAVWTEMLSEVNDAGQLVVHVEKHKDAPKPDDIVYDIAPITVDLDRMPEYVDESYRQSLVLRMQDPRSKSGARVSRIHLEKLAEFMSTAFVEDSITKAQLFDILVNEHGHTKQLAFKVMADAVRRGWIVDVGTDSRPRYRFGAVEDEAPPSEDPAAVD